MDRQHWIFLSPHFDDVALSCGGLVWDLARQGHELEIWTLMGGFPPDTHYSKFAQENHQRWGLSGEEAIRMRRSEDQAACQILNAQPRHFDWLDAIYRKNPKSGAPLVIDNESLFSTPPEAWLVEEIAGMLERELPQNVRLASPAGIGTHIDHLAVVRAAQNLGGTLFYYADYPYILKYPEWPIVAGEALYKCDHPLFEDALQAWQDAVLVYPSQISDFWGDVKALRLAYRNYLAGGGGRLWQKSTA